MHLQDHAMSNVNNIESKKINTARQVDKPEESKEVEQQCLDLHMYVCMYVCMYYVCMYACIMYVCIMYVCMHACMHMETKRRCLEREHIQYLVIYVYTANTLVIPEHTLDQYQSG